MLIEIKVRCGTCNKVKRIEKVETDDPKAAQKCDYFESECKACQTLSEWDQFDAA